MNPWDLYNSYGENLPPEERIIKSWEGFKPQHFYFAVAEEEPTITLVYLVPVEYFDKYSYMFQDSMAIANILPPDLEELQDGMYEIERSKLGTIGLLTRQGFIWGQAFQKFVEVMNCGFGLTA